LLENAGVSILAEYPRVDEESLRSAMTAEGVTARDMADLLAEAKARKVSGRRPGDLVLGGDQVLDHQGAVLGKARDRAELTSHLKALRGTSHRLWSALVLYEGGQPIWRHIEKAELEMHEFSDTYLEAYLDRHGADLLASVGGYQVEGEGIRLFSRIEGDIFTIQGLPLVPLLRQLRIMGRIAT
jgi:septum formation protein